MSEAKPVGAPPKPAAKKGPKARLSTLYEYSYEKGHVKLKNKKCPRCGNVMAFHSVSRKRWTCGSCSYTDFVKD